MNPAITPADAQMIREFYGQDVPYTVRAFAAVLDGKPLAVTGTYIEGNRTILFADVSDEMRERFKKTGVKLGRRVMQEIRAAGRTVIARANDEVQQSGRFLEYLGFKPLEDEVYIWHS